MSPLFGATPPLLLSPFRIKDFCPQVGSLMSPLETVNHHL